MFYLCSGIADAFLQAPVQLCICYLAQDPGFGALCMVSSPLTPAAGAISLLMLLQPLVSPPLHGLLLLPDHIRTTDGQRLTVRHMRHCCALPEVQDLPFKMAALVKALQGNCKTGRRVLRELYLEDTDASSVLRACQRALSELV